MRACLCTVCVYVCVCAVTYWTADVTVIVCIFTVPLCVCVCVRAQVCVPVICIVYKALILMVGSIVKVSFSIFAKGGGGGKNCIAQT